MSPCVRCEWDFLSILVSFSSVLDVSVLLIFVMSNVQVHSFDIDWWHHWVHMLRFNAWSKFDSNDNSTIDCLMSVLKSTLELFGFSFIFFPKMLFKMLFKLTSDNFIDLRFVALACSHFPFHWKYTLHRIECQTLSQHTETTVRIIFHFRFGNVRAHTPSKWQLRHGKWSCWRCYRFVILSFRCSTEKIIKLSSTQLD